MTTKHFIELADMVKDIKPSSVTFMAGTELDAANSQWLRTRNGLSEFCAAQNPRFNRALWLDYIDGKCANQAEVKSNARLIAAAPELLEACRLALESVPDCHPQDPVLVYSEDERCPSDHPNCCGNCRVYYQLTAAIRKATGK